MSDFKSIFCEMWWVATVSPRQRHQQRQSALHLVHAAQTQRLHCQQGVGLSAAAPEAAAGLPAVLQPVAVTAFVRRAQERETHWAPQLAAVLMGLWVWSPASEKRCVGGVEGGAGMADWRPGQSTRCKFVSAYRTPALRLLL